MIFHPSRKNFYNFSKKILGAPQNYHKFNSPEEKKTANPLDLKPSSQDKKPTHILEHFSV
jgi:hypothetical protein